jgi:hypothetical protein
MASTIPLPDGLTSASLREAKGSEILFWIEKTNAVAGKRVLTKNGRVDDKRKRLAEYYNINLSAGAAVVAASVRPKTDEEHIKERQFSWLRELGEEWSRTTSAGREFALCDGSSGMSVAVVSSLPLMVLTPVHSPCYRALQCEPSARGRQPAQQAHCVCCIICRRHSA